MFEAGVSLDANPELLLASDRAFAVLRASTEELAAILPKAERPPALMMALHIWAMAHGVASLFARGDAARRKVPMASGGSAGGRRPGLSARAWDRQRRDPKTSLTLGFPHCP